MADGIAVSEALAGVQRPLQADDFTLKPRIGYCADCGTWDAHGRVCAACGYDFTPESAHELPTAITVL